MRVSARHQNSSEKADSPTRRADMGDPDPGSDRRMAARSRYGRFRSSGVSGPGIRVIELHILGMQVQLLSINMGRRWPPSSSCRSPANAAHWRIDRTITVQRRHGFVNRYGQSDFIKNSQLLLLLLLSEVLDCLRRTMQRGVVASSMSRDGNAAQVIAACSDQLKPVLSTTASFWRSHFPRRPLGPVQN
jgi:hypothetical protein